MENQNKPRIYTYTPKMKIWLGVKKGLPKTFYSFELRNTLRQIVLRSQYPNIDYQYGLDSLKTLIETKLKGKYNEAIIYWINSEPEKDVIICKYVNDQLIYNRQEESAKQNFDFSSPFFQEFKEKEANRIVSNIQRSHIVKHIMFPKQPIYKK